MSMEVRPEVRRLNDGSVCWEHVYDSFRLKAYVPANDLVGRVNNYGFKAPLLFVFEEKPADMDTAIEFAKTTGLAEIAASHDASVLFVYPTSPGGWKDAPASLYVDLIAEVRMDTVYSDGLDEFHDFFAKKFRGYFIRGTKFRTDIYSYGESADFVAQNLLKTIEGEYLWGPGEITPAVCSMERLNVTPDVQRKDIAVLSVGNSDDINAAFNGCENLLIKDKAEYIKDFKSFVWKYKMWCGHIELEPDFEELKMTEEPGIVTVKTSPNHFGAYKDEPEHKVGYFAYYNNDLFDKGPAPLLIGFHGGGDSSMYLTYVAEWYRVAHDHDFLFVSIDNHLDVTPTEVMEVLAALKERYSIDEHRIYAGGFSMGSGKSWDMFQEYPEVFAGLAPASALFPVKDNAFSHPLDGKINMDIPVPVFYSGGEDSPLPELPFQADTCLERAQYVAKVNKVKADFASLDYDKKDSWENPIWGLYGDRVEKLIDETRGSTLTINYFDSEDGVCRTAFASVSGQQHECRHHSVENAWKFISQFTR